MMFSNCIHTFSGFLEEIAFEALFLSDLNGRVFEKHSEFINGLESFKVQMKQHISLEQSSVRIARFSLDITF